MSSFESRSSQSSSISPSFSWGSGCNAAAGAAVSSHRKHVDPDHDGLYRCFLRNHPRLCDDADRACGVFDQRHRLRREFECGWREHGHGAPQAQSFEHHRDRGVSNRLEQIRSELPREIESPVVEVQRADRPYATFYVAVTSETLSPSEITDYLSRQIQPRLATIPNVQRVGSKVRGLRLCETGSIRRGSKPSVLVPPTCRLPCNETISLQP